MTNLTQIQKTQEIPEAIKAYMDKTGANQSTISKLSKVNVTTLSFILKGETEIPNKSGKTVISDKYYEIKSVRHAPSRVLADPRTAALSR